MEKSTDMQISELIFKDFMEECPVTQGRRCGIHGDWCRPTNCFGTHLLSIAFQYINYLTNEEPQACCGGACAGKKEE